MTPKEKATELYNIYYEVINEDALLMSEGWKETLSKQCAVLAVDVILKLAEIISRSDQFTFWIQVKFILNKK